MSNPAPAGGLRKVRRATFVQVPSATIRDAALSFRARGVLAFLLDHPDGWTVDAAYIARHGKEGREAVEGALRELRAAGYYRLERRRLPGGAFAMGTAVAEEPVAEWAASHAAHHGRAVPVVITADGEVTELEPGNGFPGSGTDNGFPGPGAPASGEPAPYTDRDTDSDAEGGTLVGDVTSAASPTLEPPSRTCRRTAPHGACGACATDREALAAYETARTAEDALIARAKADAERALANVARTAELAAVIRCDLCDDDGIADGIVLDGDPVLVRCAHDADVNERIALARMAAKAATPRTRATAHRRARGLASRGA